MEHPFLILWIFGIKGILGCEVEIDHFNFIARLEDQVPKTGDTSRFRKAHRLPANKHYLICRRPANSMRLNGAWQWLATQLDSAALSFLCSLPK